ncbi:hypothetical protein [Vibrio phage vB_pir03]|nr:hypothetical protein [Vibrio phage vB_pir03]
MGQALRLIRNLLPSGRRSLFLPFQKKHISILL